MPIVLSAADLSVIPDCEFIIDQFVRRVTIEAEAALDALVEKLDTKLREWKPETAAQVRERVAEVIDLADCDVLDLFRSRSLEQEVLDLLDDTGTR